MLLRNKKTGAVANYSIILQRDPRNGSNKAPVRYGCGTLAKLNEEWEDATTEPLIKDEKIRKAVRAWAEANGETRVYYHRPTNEMCINDDKGYVIRSIKFKAEFREVIGIKSGYYTITELCGEEEE